MNEIMIMFNIFLIFPSLLEVGFKSTLPTYLPQVAS